MYNDELDMILEDAYDDGYYQALYDMGYEFDDEASEDVDIFDDDYFDANEATAIKKALVGLPGPGSALRSAIGNLVHSGRVNKSQVTSLRSCQHAYGDAKGKEVYNETVKFLIDNELVPPGLKDAVAINYTQLTPRGKRFMRGYYSAIDEIRRFDLNTASANSANANKEGIVSTGLTAYQVAKYFAKILGKSIFGFMGGGIVLGTYAIMGLIPVTFNVVDSIKSIDSSFEFRRTMRDATEDVDIFDDDYFDNAMEGNPDNKLKRQAYDRMMAYLDHGNDIAEYRYAARTNSSYGKNIGRRRDVGAHREHTLNRYGDAIATRSGKYSYKKDTSALVKASIMGDAHRDLLKAKKRDTPEKIRQTQIDEAKRYHDFRNR